MTRDQILKMFAHLAVQRYRSVLLVAAVLTVLSVLPPMLMGVQYAFRIDKMLPQDIPEARIFTQSLMDFDAADEAIIVFRLQDDSRNMITKVGKLAEEIAERLRQHDTIQSAFCRPLSKADRDFFIEEELPRRGLLYLAPERIDVVREKLQPDAMAASLRRTIELYEFAQDSEEEALTILRNALGLGDLFREALLNDFDTDAHADTEGYLVARVNGALGETLQLPDDPQTKALLLLVVQPTQPAQRTGFSREVSRLIRQTTADVLATTGPALQGRINVEYGGGYEIAGNYSNILNEVLIYTLLISLVGVILLFGYVFRRKGVVLYIGAPLVMIVLWTMGIGWVIFGSLNLISCGFAAVLVGLGVDYAIHIYNRYVEERARGHTVEKSFEISLSNTGWGVAIGMVTTCAAFLALKVTRINQLSEFGLLGAMGIFLSFPGMLLVMPALVTWQSKKREEHARTRTPTLFGLPRLADIIERHHRSIMAIGVLAAALSAGKILADPDSLSFDTGLSMLRPQVRAFEINGEIARAFSTRNPNKLHVLSFGPNERAALDEAARVQADEKRLEQDNLIEGYESLLEYLPTPAQQEAGLAKLQTIDFEKAHSDLLAILNDMGVEPDYFDYNLRLLKAHAETVQAGKIILPSSFEGTPVWRLVKRFVAHGRVIYDIRHQTPAADQYPLTLAKPAIDRQTGEIIHPEGAKITAADIDHMQGRLKRITVLGTGWTVKANLYPPLKQGNTADFAIDAEWIETIHDRLGLTPASDYPRPLGSYLSGVGTLGLTMSEIVKEDFLNLSFWVFVVAAIVLTLFFYRHPLRAIYSLTPILLGMLYLFGFMAFFGLPFNFVNILAIPIVIGLGVDNGIHLVHRFYEAGRRVRPMIADTGRAIMVTTLTSIIGFGSLVVGSGHAGIASMGALSIIALLASLIAALVVFPGILATLSPPSDRPADPQDDLD